MRQIERTNTPLLEGALTEQIIGGFYSVYNDFGFGLLESNYTNALAVELRLRGLEVAREVPIEVVYRGVPVGFYKYDMIVNGRVLVEVKSAKLLSPADERQVQNYLKASKILVGLLLHFGPSPRFYRFIWTEDRGKSPYPSDPPHQRAP
jgi:GxxExxY protein